VRFLSERNLEHLEEGSMGDVTDDENPDENDDDLDENDDVDEAAGEEGDDEEGDDAEGDDAEGDDDEEDVPRVVVGRVAELASWLSPQLARAQADRPVWFILESDEDLHELFERLPEGPPPPRVGEQILSGLRAYASERSDQLQEWLGVTDSIAYGFHATASLEEVTASFQEDGFLVVARIREGRLVPVAPVAPA
jgi:hypothetical protein